MPLLSWKKPAGSPPEHLFILVFITLVFVSLSASLVAADDIKPVPVPQECYCTGCGMRVTAEDPFASQIILDNNKTAFFCDLGDMFLYYSGHKDDMGKSAVFVKDYSSGEWVDGRRASYLTGSSVRTPMRYGILAFAERKDAEAFKKSSGGADVMTFDEVIASGVLME